MSQVRVTKERITETGPRKSSVRTTSYETKSSASFEDFGDLEASAYQTSKVPHTTIIHRTGSTSGGGAAGGSSQKTTSRSSSYSLKSGLPAEGYKTVAKQGFVNIIDAFKREKSDMTDLNSRLADYMKKLGPLEDQNRRNAEELAKLRSRWGKETIDVKLLNLDKLVKAREERDDLEKEKARYQIQCDTASEVLNELRDRLANTLQYRDLHKENYEGQVKRVTDLETELANMRKRIDAELDKTKDDYGRIAQSLLVAREDLDRKTLAHIDEENRCQSLEEEIEFLRQVFDQELKELSALAYRDTTSDNKNFWRNEMDNAMTEIQTIYESKLNGMQIEMESMYKTKIEQFRSGAQTQNKETDTVKAEAVRIKEELTGIRARLGDLEAENAQLEKDLERLRREYSEREREFETENADAQHRVAKLRMDMDAILREVTDLMDTKLGLELEIAAYRKLLEGEESRVGLREVVDTILRDSSTREVVDTIVRDSSWSDSSNRVTIKQTEETSGDSSLNVSQVVRGEMSAKTRYQRSAKGPVAISECAQDGLFITLENTGRKEETMSGWSIVRTVDDQERANVALSDGFSIRPGGKIKLYSADNKPTNASRQDIEVDVDTWGIGSNIITALYNPAGEERARHEQTTSYS